jgi:uncharacterized protein
MHIHKSNLKYILKKISKILFLVFIIVLCVQYGPRLYQKGYVLALELLTTKKIVVLGHATVKVEVADTYEKRILGLSGKEDLPRGTGMLFVFEKPGLYGIWMKDMNFDLDIIWVNEYREVIYIVENATPDSYPETFLPPTESLYVLEVPAGFVNEHGVKLGDIVDFL